MKKHFLHIFLSILISTQIWGSSVIGNKDLEASKSSVIQKNSTT